MDTFTMSLISEYLNIQSSVMLSFSKMSCTHNKHLKRGVNVYAYQTIMKENNVLSSINCLQKNLIFCIYSNEMHTCVKSIPKVYFGNFLHIFLRLCARIM